MINNIFKREEEKYILDSTQYHNILNKLKKHIIKDDYYKSHIYNLYFDDDNSDGIINSIEKPLYKYKIRLRSYDIENIDSSLFLEVKVKYNKTSYKRRLKLTYEEYLNYVSKGIIPNHDSQIGKEIDNYIKKDNYKPKILIAYDRYSYKSKDDSSLRITFDYNLRSRMGNLDITDGYDYTDYFKKTYYIMEIKTTSAYPLWLAKILSSEMIYPISFSKYGKIYEQNQRSDISVK